MILPPIVQETIAFLSAIAFWHVFCIVLLFTGKSTGEKITNVKDKLIAALIAPKIPGKSTGEKITNVKDSDQRNAIRGGYHRLEQLYEHERNKNRRWLVYSVIVMVLGVFCVISTFILAYPGNITNFVGSTYIALVLISVGSFLYMAGIFSFRQAREANNETDIDYINHLIDTELVSQFISLISAIPDLEDQNRLKERIILQILLPTKGEKIARADPMEDSSKGSKTSHEYKDGLAPS